MVADEPGRFGRYRLDRPLGAGGMGQVYLATDTVTGRQVALKLVQAHLAADAGFRARFDREASALSRLDSPHVLRILDYGEHDGTPYLATQLIAGGDLGALLRAHGPVTPHLALEIAAQVCRGLAATHAAGVVHRDIKPANVLLYDADLSRPHVVLCDFGIAHTEAPAITRTGEVVGSWAYLSPERLEGSPGGIPSDIYAVGCLIWTMLSGRPPFVGTDLQVAQAHLAGRPPQVAGRSTLAHRINAVLLRAMARDPGERYLDATSMADALTTASRLAAGDVAIPPRSATAGSLPAPVDRPRRRWLPAAVVGAALALVAAGAVVGLVRHGGGGGGESGASGGYRAPVAGDVTGDGRGDLALDAAVTDPKDPLGTSPRREVWASGSGGLAAQPQVTKIDLAPTVAADFDRDGRLDLAQYHASVGAGADHIVVTSGRAHRAETLAAAPPSGVSDQVFVTTVIAGNFGGDARPDLALLVKDHTHGTCSLWVDLRHGTGFSAARRWLADAPCEDYAVGDADGDGRDELAVAAPTSSSGGAERPSVVLTYRAEGARFVRRHVARLPGTGRDSGGHWPWQEAAVTAGDVDGRPGDEVVVAVTGPSKIRFVVLSGGRDGWTSPRTWSETSPAMALAQKYRISVTDVDGDGKGDLAELEYGDDDGDEQAPAVVRVFGSNGHGFTAPADRRTCAGCGHFPTSFTDAVGE